MTRVSELLARLALAARGTGGPAGVDCAQRFRGEPGETLGARLASAGDGERVVDGRDASGRGSQESSASFFQPRLESARLCLRPFELADAAAVSRLAGAREIADTTISIPHPYPSDLAQRWVGSRDSAYASGKTADFAIGPLDTGELVGCVGLREIDREHLQAELGYWIGVPYWNRGYASEAAARLLEFAFGELGLNRIYAHHMARNPASGAVLRRVGFQLEGRLRQRVRKWGVYEDVLLYARLRHDP